MDVVANASTLVAVREADALALAFPSNWPAAFKQDAQLKHLVNKADSTRSFGTFE